MFNKDTGEVKPNLPQIPEKRVEYSYKLSIAKVTKTIKPKTEDRYFDKKTGEQIEWSKWYDLSDEEKKQYAKHKVFTGDFETDRDTHNLYEQEMQDIDISDIAMYINRSR